jgi:Ran GTPase-activating protein (RanGAP) involved in mRNA processing and transport
MLAEGIKANETLTNLHMSHCNILEEGAVLLAGALQNKKNLLVLDLNNNKIMTGGCNAICKAIQ